MGVSVASTSTANHSHGFNTRQWWHSRPFGGVVVHLLGVGSLWWLFGGFLAVLRCSLVVQPTKSRQRAITPHLRHFSALGGLSLRLGRFRAVSALYRLRSVATICASMVWASLWCVGFRLCWCRGLEASSRWVVASRLSPYSLALSSRVSAWVVNLPLNRLIASCFFASTIFA